jgi:enediyne biosynthesis protein E5
LFIALAIVGAMRGVGLYVWAAWQSIRANQRGRLMLQPGMAGTAKGMSAG